MGGSHSKNCKSGHHSGRVIDYLVDTPLLFVSLSFRWNPVVFLIFDVIIYLPFGRVMLDNIDTLL